MTQLWIAYEVNFDKETKRLSSEITGVYKSQSKALETLKKLPECLALKIESRGDIKAEVWLLTKTLEDGEFKVMAAYSQEEAALKSRIANCELADWEPDGIFYNYTDRDEGAVYAVEPWPVF